MRYTERGKWGLIHLLNIDATSLSLSPSPLPHVCVCVQCACVTKSCHQENTILSVIVDAKLKDIPSLKVWMKCRCRFQQIIRVSLSSTHSSPVTLGTFTVSRLLHWDTKRHLVTIFYSSFLFDQTQCWLVCRLKSYGPKKKWHQLTETFPRTSNLLYLQIPIR